MDEPVDPTGVEGGLPHEQLPISGGACEWVSHYWAETDGSVVWAGSWSVTVEYDGRAAAQSWHAPEGTDCGG
jgi:hypothetical protein